METWMKQVAEYRQRAMECLKFAQQARTDEERKLLTGMAAAWERMALGRERQLACDQGSEPEQDVASDSEWRRYETWSSPSIIPKYRDSAFFASSVT